MTQTGTAQLGDAIERARRVRPVLAEHAAATEAAGRPHPAGIAAVRAAQLFALPVPERFGGPGATVGEITRVLIELGRGCPSTAWVAGTSATGKTFAGCGLSEDGLAAVFADPGTVVCGSGKPSGTAVPVPGGYRLSGRWDYVSGIEDATLAGVGAMVQGGTPTPIPGQCLVPTDQLIIERTWDTAGLRGTGSHTAVARDVFVPAECVGVVEFGPTFVLTGTAYLLGPVLGAALGAHDATEQLFASGANRFGSTYHSIAESPGAQRLFTEATVLLDNALDRTHTCTAAIDSGAIATPRDLFRSRSAFAAAAKDALAALDRMLDLHGTKGMAATHPVQRCWRDASAGARHTLLNQFMIAEEYGKLLAHNG